MKTNNCKEIYGIIYLIKNTINNKLYFGQTTQEGGFDSRYGSDVKKFTHNEHLKTSIEKYGIENFYIDKKFDIACSKEELDKLEDMYIKMYNTTNRKYGYNKRYGGSKGKLTKEEKIKISNTLIKRYSNKEIISWNKGKKCPQLSGELNSFYGRKHTLETKIKMSKNHWLKNGGIPPLLGKHLSMETKLKISASKKGKYIGKNNKNYKSITVKCDVCGKEHERQPYKINAYNYCSNECRSKGIKMFHSGKNSKLYNKKIINCIFCGKEIEVCKSNIGKSKYCSQNCKNNHQKSSLVGGNNPNAKRVICITTGICFNSCKEGAEYYNCSNRHIGTCCQGITKSCGRLQDGTRLKWMYYDEYLKQQ